MDKYDIIKQIGNGSHGDVYLVRSTIDKKKYVMKKIFLKEREKTKDTLHEVNVLSQLKHPNIVEYFESFQIENNQFLCIIMAYCESGDLFTTLQKKKNEFISEYVCILKVIFIFIC